MGKSELFLSIPQILNTALLIVLLTVEGIWDWKTRRIRMDAVLLCAAAGICLRIADRMTVCSYRYDGPSLLASFLPGAVLLLLAVLGRGIGSGDAALFLTAGLLWGQETAELAFFTFLLAAAPWMEGFRAHGTFYADLRCGDCHRTAAAGGRAGMRVCG